MAFPFAKRFSRRELSRTTSDFPYGASVHRVLFFEFNNGGYNATNTSKKMDSLAVDSP